MTTRKQKTQNTKLPDKPANALKKPLEEEPRKDKLQRFKEPFLQKRISEIVTSIMKKFPNDVNQIIELLKDENWKNKRNALLVLGRIVENSVDITTTSPLVKALGDKNDDVRRYSAMALEKAIKKNHKARETIVKSIMEFMNSHSFMVEAEKNSDRFIQTIKAIDQLARKIDELERKAA